MNFLNYIMKVKEGIFQSNIASCNHKVAGGGGGGGWAGRMLDSQSNERHLVTGKKSSCFNMTFQYTMKKSPDSSHPSNHGRR